ncbi:hypothetical protein BSKO_09177 [Bryopsis sp. KO-2023]|nr:hypothetical protein BSKO_09177 [Bryopsis sp. KO-2023]
MGKFAAELQAINKGTMGFLDSSPESGEMRTERKKRRHNNSSPSRSRSRSSSRRSDNSDISSSSSSGRSGRSRRRRRSWGPTIRGKRVARSVSRSLSPSRTPSKDLGLRGESPGLVDAINSTVFVGNVSEKTDERDLREFFQKFGTVVETKVVFDPDTHQSRCFGFVKFSSANDADLAVSQAHGKVLEGNTIRCNLARYPPPSSRKGESDRDSPERSKMSLPECRNEIGE